MKTVCAWERDGKFYLSRMMADQTLNGRTPAREFASKAELEAEVHRRNGRVAGTEIDAKKNIELIWEFLPEFLPEQSDG